MRTVLVLLLVACDSDPMSADPDASIDSAPTGGTYWPCYSWQGTSPTVSMCAPQCSNYGTVGKYATNDDMSCAISDTAYCDPKYINGPAYNDGVGCCVYVPSEPERVEFIACR